MSESVPLTTNDVEVWRVREQHGRGVLIITGYGEGLEAVGHHVPQFFALANALNMCECLHSSDLNCCPEPLILTPKAVEALRYVLDHPGEFADEEHKGEGDE
jgi:hypothetical protein